MAFLTYNLADNTTGEIIAQIGVDTDNDANAVTNNTPSGATAYVGDPLDTSAIYYYVSGVKTARPLMSTVGSWNTTSITADGISTATFGSSLPNPTTVVVQLPIGVGLTIPGPITVTTGSFSLTTPVPGIYNVIIDAFPYVQLATEITAT